MVAAQPAWRDGRRPGPGRLLQAGTAERRDLLLARRRRCARAARPAGVHRGAAAAPAAVPYDEDREAWNAYYNSCWDYEYGQFEVAHDFGTGKYVFTFTDSDHSNSGHYEATMTEPDGTSWRCVYDYGYGAGLTDLDGEG